MSDSPESSGVSSPIRRGLPVLKPVSAPREERESNLSDRGDDGSIPFRDPPSPDEEARALRNTIAQALVRVPQVPIALPRFSLTLTDLTTLRNGVKLHFGSPDPVATVTIEYPRGAESPTLDLAVLSGARDHVRTTLTQIVERLRVAITRERWDSVRESIRALHRLPVAVPMGFFRQRVAGVRIPTGLIRTGFDCNQDCGMCWQGRDWGRFGSDAVMRWIEDLHTAGITEMILSGGEPMLDRNLVDYIRLATSLGVRVVLETNAMLAGRSGYAQSLARAGLVGAFVSLHSGNPATSDRITRAPGTHALTVQGIHALLEADVPTTLNAVMTAEGLEDLASLPDFVHQTFKRHPALKTVMISYPTHPFDPGLLPVVMPEPRKLRSVLGRMIERAVALDLPLSNLGGPCGAPLCLFDADPRVCTLEPVPGPVPFRMYAPGCASCEVQNACFGIRPTDRDLFGTDWVTPLKRVSPAAERL